jgi:hypothetical protein
MSGIWAQVAVVTFEEPTAALWLSRRELANGPYILNSSCARTIGLDLPVTGTPIVQAHIEEANP